MTTQITFQPGDKVVVLQVPHRGKRAKVSEQYTFQEGDEIFEGDVLIETADGKTHIVNNWQITKEENYVQD